MSLKAPSEIHTGSEVTSTSNKKLAVALSVLLGGVSVQALSACGIEAMGSCEADCLEAGSTGGASGKAGAAGSVEAGKAGAAGVAEGGKTGNSGAGAGGSPEGGKSGTAGAAGFPEGGKSGSSGAGAGGSPEGGAAGSSGAGTGGSPEGGAAGSSGAGTGGSPEGGAAGSSGAGAGGSPEGGAAGSSGAGTGGSPEGGAAGSSGAGTGGSPEGGAAGSSGAGAGGSPEGGAAGAAGGCADIPVKFRDMSGYALRIYASGQCTEAQVSYSNYANGATTFSGADVDLCLKKGDVVVAQVEDSADLNSLEFDSPSVPVELRLRDITSSTPVTFNVNRAMCSSLSGWTTVDVGNFDVNPAQTGYKFNGKTDGNGNVAASSGFYIKM